MRASASPVPALVPLEDTNAPRARGPSFTDLSVDALSRVQFDAAGRLIPRSPSGPQGTASQNAGARASGVEPVRNAAPDLSRAPARSGPPPLPAGARGVAGVESTRKLVVSHITSRELHAATGATPAVSGARPNNPWGGPPRSNPRGAPPRPSMPVSRDRASQDMFERDEVEITRSLRTDWVAEARAGRPRDPIEMSASKSRVDNSPSMLPGVLAAAVGAMVGVGIMVVLASLWT